MGMSEVSKIQISRLCGEADGRVTAFLGRPLEGAIRMTSLHCSEVLCSLAHRGLRGLLIITDEHKWPKAAVAKVIGATSSTGRTLRLRRPRLTV